MIGPGALRLVLASLVVLSHASAIKLGGIAVVVFFMLSGYWVTRQFRTKYLHGPRPVVTFYLARFLRLWPPYVAAVLIAFVAFVAVSGSADPRWWVGLPVLGAGAHDHDLLGVSWSLDVELQFYLIAPVVFGLLALRSGLLIVIPAAFALTWIGWAFRSATDVETVLAFLLAFVAGALIDTFRLKVSRGAATLSLAIVVAALIGIEVDLGPLGGLGNDPRFGTTDRLAILVLGLMLVPVVANAVTVWSGPLDRLAGDFSYSLYLLHVPFIVLAGRVYGAELPPPVKLAVIAGAYATAFAFFILVDRPLERWRVAFLERRSGEGLPGGASVARQKG